ncbi:hypothetical protein [Acetonema longum]|uniref:Uncharacterized protein n=1 Tax=Acetonema longum DSM 6540 TaxID=1009370 RepID=F7NK21_9FIRM|nr:hypothetical protein [Acetonema longum]EGO63668.1 hypothetical protein ALO_12164 [Acetonema longum DSM 6540]
MQKFVPLRCVDIHTDHCPCLLAETNHCFMCSHLQGKEVCDCNWTGQCLLYEKIWQSVKQKNLRREVESAVHIVRYIPPSTYLLDLRVDAIMGQQLSRLGSFVFIRALDDPEICSFPVGIMDISHDPDTDSDTLHVAIETVGPKSSRIFLKDQAKISVRGPYYNGIFGQPWIESMKHGKIFLLAGGIGQACSIMIVRTLIASGNDVTAVIAPGKVGALFVADRLKKMGCTVLTVSSMRDQGFGIVAEAAANREVDLVVSAGPDTMHHGLIDHLGEIGLTLPMAVTNNTKMCCGEGICGSCVQKTKDGQWVRTCKAQLDYRQLELS